MEIESKSKKKGCLSGCLTAFVIIIILIAALAVIGYFNRHTILPFITDKLGMEVSSIVQYAGGTKTETGMPPQFLNNAYKIDLPQGDKTIRITTSDVPVDETYDRFIQYFKEDGWEVKKEMEAMEVAPEQFASVSKYLEDELKGAELTRNGRRMGMGVTRYNEKTVAAVWQAQGTDAQAADSKSADSKPARSKPERSEPKKADNDKELPEEVSGSDPEDIPVYPDSVRTSHQKMEKGGRILHAVSYAAEAAPDEVLAFYETEIKNSDWQIVQTAEKQDKKYMEATKAEDTVRIIIGPSENYEGYTKMEVAAEYRSRK
ncbi:MAG: hypothetical protein ACQERN_04580 [Thermodesulfobacteriota bacterium]